MSNTIIYWIPRIRPVLNLIGDTGQALLEFTPVKTGAGMTGTYVHRHSRGNGNPDILPQLIENLRKKAAIG